VRPSLLRKEFHRCDERCVTSGKIPYNAQVWEEPKWIGIGYGVVPVELVEVESTSNPNRILLGPSPRS
jgi:hypothetical protein